MSVTACDTTTMEASTNIFTALWAMDACTGHLFFSVIFLMFYLILFISVQGQGFRAAMIGVSAIVSFLFILMGSIGWIPWTTVSIPIVGLFASLIIALFIP